MYKISDLAKISGVSTRTLRFYDEIEILKPSKVDENKYRFYSEYDLDKLQQILFYKNLGFSLNEITQIVNSKDFNIESSLIVTLEKYKAQRKQIDSIISNIEKSLKSVQGGSKMNAKEKFKSIQEFEKFKSNMLEENEQKYGTEINNKYDKEKVAYSKNKVKNMTKEEYAFIENLGIEIIKLLEENVSCGSFNDVVAKEVYEKHKEWLCFYWGKYSTEAHRGVCDMYLADERFKNYYDKNVGGCAEFLHKCVYHVTSIGLKD